jgi:hypothetical protein|tara:strand:+ start:807 stop:1145 length:339 start_codon:yes stop_codon:yes gene_type:complete
MEVNKTTIYYIIVASIFLMNFSFIPLLLEVLQQRNMTNIPYLTLITMLISQILLLFVVFYRGYYYHIFIYLVGFVCISTLLFLKPMYDNKNIQVINRNVYNIIEESKDLDSE